MQIAVDISLYPLDENYIPPIKNVIARLQAHEAIDVATNSMSTQLRGDFDVVMPALQQEIARTFSQLPKAVFAIKIINDPHGD